MSQRELARQAKVDNSFISRVESGERTLATADYATVVRLAAALSIAPSELVPEQEVGQ